MVEVRLKVIGSKARPTLRWNGDLITLLNGEGGELWTQPVTAAPTLVTMPEWVGSEKNIRIQMAPGQEPMAVKTNGKGKKTIARMLTCARVLDGSVQPGRLLAGGLALTIAGAVLTAGGTGVVIWMLSHEWGGRGMVLLVLPGLAALGFGLGKIAEALRAKRIAADLEAGRDPATGKADRA